MLLPDSFEIINYKNEVEIIPWYRGHLDARPTRVIEVRLGFMSVRDQTRRCNSLKDPSYHKYGGIGLKVEYSYREFLSWWICHLKVYLHNWEDSDDRGIRPTCGRIDHTKGYNFQNIRLESMRDNSNEMIKRVGTPTKPIAILQIKDGIIVNRFPSASEAGRRLGINRESIRDSLGRNKISHGFVWRFEADSDKI